ncbi:hypothetical protein [Mucilaginibacter ginsenosidivorans]|uniref:Uncharacterized protein n=1 Tax=Mucilaginibacter ginsenosidivorans TaxID=398053 RepID=A0A5B8UZI3_9SPHI|nr:hypothetical protein [Mucilaginibacter ginsenosidivorans]QEC64419.1 hypothetical protein FRZ54_18170 [Mucilaginibacter ginsenosidivorans]
MKNLFLIACSLILLSACSKKEDVPPGQTFRNKNGLYVNFSNEKWYVTKDGTFATVNLKLAGTTNGDRITMRTSGDGLLLDNNLALKSGKFTTDGGIWFTHAAPDTGTLHGSTEITVYRGSDTLVVHLVSDDLSY